MTCLLFAKSVRYHLDMALRDSYGRTIRSLRLSLTDRCNFRCFYCLPNGEPSLAHKDKILSIEELAQAAEIFVSLGIEKIRLTGGEPLLRRGITSLVASLAALKPDLKDIALTTNGYELPRHVDALKAAGLDRITISLDSLDPKRFAEITGVDALDKVLNSIDVARDAGFETIKLNAVVVRGRNEDEVVDMARFAREKGISFRFIEYMPLDSGREWDRTMVVSGREIHDAIDAVFPLELTKARGRSTAWNYRFADGAAGEIGIIAPVTDSFCGACSRIRLTADGQIRTCLFSTVEHDLRGAIRSGADREEIAKFIRGVVHQKEERHLIDEEEFVQPARSMSFIGG